MDKMMLEELPVNAGINTVTNCINRLKMSFHHKKVVEWHFFGEILCEN